MNTKSIIRILSRRTMVIGYCLLVFGTQAAFAQDDDAIDDEEEIVVKKKKPVVKSCSRLS